jgi:hypothetical protein
MSYTCHLGFESTCNEKKPRQQVAVRCPSSEAYTRQPKKKFRLHGQKKL